MWDLVSQPGTGMEPGPLHAEYRILACEPPGKSLWVLLWPPPHTGRGLSAASVCTLRPKGTVWKGVQS